MLVVVEGGWLVITKCVVLVMLARAVIIPVAVVAVIYVAAVVESDLHILRRDRVGDNIHPDNARKGN